MPGVGASSVVLVWRFGGDVVGDELPVGVEFVVDVWSPDPSSVQDADAMTTRAAAAAVVRTFRP